MVVNILTNLAYHKREITIFGGAQLRPNIHISDMVESYVIVLNAEQENVSGQIYNAGYENQTVQELAEIVKKVIGDDVMLRTMPTDDNRSYHISSEKIRVDLGFTPKFDIEDAVRGLRDAFDRGLIPNSLDDEKYFNIKKMQSIGLD